VLYTSIQYQLTSQQAGTHHLASGANTNVIRHRHATCVRSQQISVSPGPGLGSLSRFLTVVNSYKWGVSVEVDGK